MNRVREIREALGMTQVALGQAARIHPISICKIENGHANPWPKTMTAIAEALGCAFAEAFPDAPPPKPAKPSAESKAAAITAEVLGVSERLGQGRCRWCGRRDVKDQASVLVVAGETVYETGHIRCMREYIVENTDRGGNWKKHRNTGLR